MKRVTHVGRYVVEDNTRPGRKTELTLAELAGYERRAARTVLREVAHVEPNVLRYARKAIGLTQAELAKLLGVKPETVSRWETGDEPFKETVQLALATLLDIVERGGGPAKLAARVPAPRTGEVKLKAS